VEKEKLDSFNLPFYAPSVDEVRDVIRQSEAFDINHIHLFESNWDPHDDLDDGDLVLDSAQSGANVAQCIRAVIEPLVAHHFGEHILDDLFEIYARNVAAHLRKVKTKYSVIVLSLAARRAQVPNEWRLLFAFHTRPVNEEMTNNLGHKVYKMQLQNIYSSWTISSRE